MRKLQLALMALFSIATIFCLIFMPLIAFGQLAGGSSGGVRTVGDCTKAKCGVAPNPLGALLFSGSSGTGTLRCVGSALSSPTWSLGTTSGTLASSFAAPISIHSTTGVVSLSGTVDIANGGTGQTTRGPAFNALSPLTTKGSIISRTTSNNVEVFVGSDNTVLTADSGSSAGVSFAKPLSGFGGDGSDGSCSWSGSAWSTAGCFFGCPNSTPCTVGATAGGAVTEFGSTSMTTPGGVAITRVALRQFTSLSITGAYTANFPTTINVVAIMVQDDATLTAGTLNLNGVGDLGGAAATAGTSNTLCAGGGGGANNLQSGGAGGSAAIGTAGKAGLPNAFRFPMTELWTAVGTGGGGGCHGTSATAQSGVGATSTTWNSVNFAGTGGGAGGCTATGSGSSGGGAGGRGGGGFSLRVGGKINMTSGFVVTVNGANGSNGTTKGSGGGGGGGGSAVVLYRSATSAVTSSFTATGGTGGTAAGTGCYAGGNGGAGVILAKQVF